MSSPTPSAQGPGIEKYGSKTDAFIKVMLVFFISLLSFSVGTYVGKKFSDKEHKLAQLEPQGALKDQEAAKSETHGEDHVAAEGHADKSEHTGEKSVKHKGEPLSDDEIAKLAQEFVSEDEVKNKLAEIENPKDILDEDTEMQVPVVEAKPITTVAKPITTVAKPITTVAKPIATVAKPIATVAKPLVTVAKPSVAAKKVTPAAPVREVASVDLKEPAKAIHDSTKKTVATIAKKTESNVETSTPGGKYTVQVSAFTNEKDASRLKAELEDKGLSSLIVPAEVKGKQFYRVSVGLFKTESEAKIYLKDLLTKDVVKSAIVQKVAVKQ